MTSDEASARAAARTLLLLGCVDASTPDWVLDSTIARLFRSRDVDVWCSSKSDTPRRLKNALRSRWGLRALPKGLGERVERRAWLILHKIRIRLNNEYASSEIDREYSLLRRKMAADDRRLEMMFFCANKAGVPLNWCEATVDAWCRDVLFERIGCVGPCFIVSAKRLRQRRDVKLYLVKAFRDGDEESVDGYVVRDGYTKKTFYAGLEDAEKAWRAACTARGLRVK